MQPWSVALRLLHIFRRWWILVLVAEVLSGATAIYLLRQRPLQYRARTTLMVGTNLRSPNPSQNLTGVSTTLAAFYAEMARRTPITGRVVERLDLPFGPGALNGGMVSTRVVPSAQLVEISVIDTDSERAARIANTIAEELIAYSPAAPEKIEAQRQFTQSQLDDLAAKIESTDERLQELNTQLQTMSSAGEIAEAQQRLGELESIKAGYQETYTGLLGSLGDSTVNTLSIFEPAEPSRNPLPQPIFPSIVLASMLGLLIGMAAAWVLDEVDDRWRGGRSPDLFLDMPTLGHVTTNAGPVSSKAALHSPRGRQCLELRSEVLLRLGPTARTTLMVTSARASLERSRLTADLARLFAHSGQHTLLIDANLGEDFLYSSFGIAGDGVRVLLREPEHPVENLVRPTEEPNLDLLPGSKAGQSARLVPALHWPRAVDAVERAAEVVLFDGPPVLESADAALLAPHMGGIVLVIDPALEGRAETRRAIARLAALDAPLFGVVLLHYERGRFWQFLRRPLRRPDRANVMSAAVEQ